MEMSIKVSLSPKQWRTVLNALRHEAINQNEATHIDFFNEIRRTMHVQIAVGIGEIQRELNEFHIVEEKEWKFPHSNLSPKTVSE